MITNNLKKLYYKMYRELSEEIRYEIVVGIVSTLYYYIPDNSSKYMIRKSIFHITNQCVQQNNEKFSKHLVFIR